MTTAEFVPPMPTPTAAEPRRLAPADRDTALAAAAALAEDDYLHNRELTAFEAFGGDTSAD